MEIFRDRRRFRYLTMAVFLMSATALGSFASVCRAACCIPTLAKAEASVQAEHSCCADSPASSQAEAARFFAEDSDFYTQLLLADDYHQCHMESSDLCIATLALETEYISAPTVSSDHHTPAAALAKAGHHEIRWGWASNSSTHSGNTSPPPGSPPVYLTTSSFLC